MKKTISVFLTALIFALSALLAGCGNGSASSDGAKGNTNDKKIVIGASVTPHAEILKEVKKILAEDGYTLEIKEYNDYVLPNTATESGELDANYFQHITYLNDFNQENKTHLVSAVSVHYEPFGVYAGKTTDLSKLSEGATVAVPNDSTNEARALLLLEAQGLIKLKSGSGLSATKLSIEENKLNLNIKEIEAAQLVRSLPDVDIAVINGNYAIQGGLKVKEALAVEASDSIAAKNYANVIAVKEGNENSDKIQALVKAITNDKIRDYINDTYNGAVVPLF